ncbi:MAG: RagB/SusD family nutrient uptake outer membrane protein [Bacteroidales bacterium]|nr:RagB/SusD family nutrient uptake outer membrane protein [Bacteroidales bacterium]
MKLKNILLVSSALLCFSSCDDLFEPAIENQQDITQMFKDKEFARGILGSAYLQLPYSGSTNSDVATDDAVSNDPANDYLKMAIGGWASNADPMSQWQGRYNAIQYCNIMIENAEKVEWATDETLNKLYVDHFLGNAYAMRGLQFFYLLRAHAGVDASGELMGAPIHTASEDGGSDFNQPRASFKECIDQILADLAEAEKYLPFTYGDVAQNDPVLAKYNCTNGQYNRAFGSHEIGKIDGKIIAAVRAQVALFAASPAYQAGNAMTWEEAAKYAGNLLEKIGGTKQMEQKGYTWYCNADELDKLGDKDNTNEIIWRDNIGKPSNDDKDNWVETKNFPPSLEGKGLVNPSQNLVDAFGMANGRPITDAKSGYDPAKPYEGRDPRLEAYIVYNGSKIGENEIHTAVNADNLDGIGTKPNYSTRTGYYMRKFTRDDVSVIAGKEVSQNHYNARIRATEIFLAYAEAANEAGGPNGKYGDAAFSAKDVIKALRERAGICVGTPDAYLNECAASKEQMRELIRNERRIELCFENQRFYDLRRWNVDTNKLNEGVKGIQITAEKADGTIEAKYIDVENRAYKDYMIYGPLPYSEIMKWNNLSQNKGW